MRPDKENLKKKRAAEGLSAPFEDEEVQGARRKAAAYSGGLVLAPKAWISLGLGDVSWAWAQEKLSERA